MVMSVFEVDPLQSSAWRTVTWPSNDSVDLSVLNSFEDSQLDGEGDLIVELIDLYLGEGKRQVEVIHEAIDKKDSLAIKSAAHSLRGSSSNIGVLQMALICEQIEKHAAAEAFPYLQELTHSLTHEFEHVCVLLRAERERRTDEDSYCRR